MNILFRMEKGIAVCLFSSFFVLACVNHIPGEKAAVSNGDIPLKFTADIHEVTYTRVAGNGFEDPPEAYEQPLRQEAILHGISHLQHS